MKNKVTWEREYFAGRWAVTRDIVDTHGASAGRFAGHAMLTHQGEAGLVYVEEGTLQMRDGPSLAATRTYLWSFESGGVEVRFSDGRRFHSFDPGGAAVAAEHLCGADQYRVTYDFRDWPRWTARWRVRGPRKDYAMVSLYRRPDPA